MKVLYWIAILAFVVIGSILGYFIIPYLSWAMNFEFYIVVLVLGAVLLLLSGALLFKFKTVSKVLLPIALLLVVSGGITTIRFGGSIRSIDRYIISYNDIYTNLGIHLTKGVDRGWIIAYDEDNNKVLVNFSSEEETIGEEEEWNIDSDGNIRKNEKGQKLYTRCDLYKVIYKIYVYDEYGYFKDKLEDYYKYTYCSNSAFDYEYHYYAVYTEEYEHSCCYNKTIKEVKAKLEDDGYYVID